MRHSLFTHLRPGFLCLAAIALLAIASLPAASARADATPAGPPMTAGAPGPGRGQDTEEEVEWELGEEVEWEWGEEEWVEEESGQAEGEAGNPTASQGTTECGAADVTARVAAWTDRDTVRLTLEYASDTPTRATIRYWLRGARGTMRFAPLQIQMRGQGTLTGVERMTDGRMVKVRAARAFVVQVDTAKAPYACERHNTRHLNVKRRDHGRTTWSQPPASPPSSSS